MTTLDLAGIITRVCTDLKDKFADKGVETSKQDTLVSGTNIKTVNSISLLGSGNVAITEKNDTAFKIRRSNYCYKSSDSSGRYRLLLTSADGTTLVPINTSTSSSSTAAKTLNTRPIDPFGAIYYYNGGAISANSTLIPSSLWTQYDGVLIGYSYVVTLTSYGPVYLKCSPNADGSAVMLEIVTALPTSDDGFIYIYLGNAYSNSGVELAPSHPVYYHDGTGIRLWTGVTSA